MRLSRVLMFGLVALMCVSMVNVPQTASAQCVLTIDDIKVLMIITTSFGWDYWQTKEQFEAWNISVTTIANTLNYEVPSCANREPRPATADFLLSDFNLTDLSQYDVLYIPSGGHWQGLISSNRVLSLISTAHEMGLIVGTTCIGNRVLCRSNNIVNHTKVAYYSQTAYEMRNEGATVINSALVVTDNGIVTGGGGGGPYGGGYTVAPTVEVCSAIVKAVKGVSCVGLCDITPTTWNATATYEIEVVRADPADCLSVLNSTDVVSMVAYVYPEGEDDTPSKTVTLTNVDGAALYTGSFEGLEAAAYHVDIQITMSDDTVEVLSLGPVISYDAPAMDLAMLIGAIGIATVIVVLGVVLIVKRRA